MTIVKNYKSIEEYRIGDLVRYVYPPDHLIALQNKVGVVRGLYPHSSDWGGLNVRWIGEDLSEEHKWSVPECRAVEPVDDPELQSMMVLATIGNGTDRKLLSYE